MRPCKANEEVTGLVTGSGSETSTQQRVSKLAAFRFPAAIETHPPIANILMLFIEARDGLHCKELVENGD